MSEKKFLSVKEASKRSGKSESTLKRFIQKAYQDGKANKDQMLDQKIRQEKAPKGFFWSIAEDFLQEFFDTPESPEDHEGLTVKFLHEQLKTKDEQIKSLLERQRETNILMKGLQDKVFFLEGEKPKESTTTEFDQSMVNQKEPKPPEKQPPSEEKKGFWGRMFR